jgi:putative ABC transport system permease protein
VVLGVAFMSGTLILNATIGRVFDDLFADFGENTDAVVRGPVLYEDQQGQTTRDLLDESVVAASAKVPGVAAAEGSVSTVTITVLDRKGDAMGGVGPPTIVGSWPTDEVMNPYEVVTGRAPTADGEAVIDRAGADKGEFKVGDRVNLVTPEGRESLRLVGITKFGEADSAGGSLFVGTTLSEAQRLSGKDGKVDEVDLRAEPGVTPETLVSRLKDAKLAPKADVLTGKAYGEEISSDIKQGFSFFTIALLVFAFIALFVGWFIISNTFSILVAQRTRELALLRAVGASRRQVLTSVIVEALVIGVVSAVVGFLSGIGLAAGAFALLNAFDIDIPQTSLVIQPSAALTAVLVGLLVTLIAAIMPAIRATRVPPLAAMRDIAVDRSAASIVRTVAGIVFLLLALLLISPAFGADMPNSKFPGVGAGLGLIMLAVLVLGPVMAKPLARIVGAWLPAVKGITGRMARQNAVRNPRRTASTAAALIVGVALVAFITVFASSAKSSINEAIGTGFKGDYIIQPANQFSFGGAPPTLGDELAKIDGVETVTPFGFFSGQLLLGGDDKPGGFIGAIDPATADKVFAFKMSKGELSTLGPGEIVVDRLIAKDKGLKIGDQLKILGDNGKTLPFRVSAISNDPALLGQWTITRTEAAKLQRQPTDFLLGIKLDKGVTVDSIRTTLRDALKPYPTMKLQDRDQYTSSIISSISALLNVIYGLLFVSILIAFIGIANTMLLSIYERTRELGLLRAMGMSRSQVRSLVRWEAVIVALLGTFIGILLGLGLSWVMVRALKGQGITEFSIAPSSVIVIVVFAAGFAVLASLWPAYKASKLDVLDAIATE